MSDKDSSFINLPDLPDSIDNAVKNLTDKPTQGIGQTFADAWYLVFGTITQAANKRRMKYAHELEIYNHELSSAIEAIPEENLVEPSIQVTAQALENSKYCIESEELRKMFVNLISKSMDNRHVSNVHPSFAEVIKQMSPTDAKIFQSLSSKYSFPLVDYVLRDPDTRQYSIQFSTVYLSSAPDISMETASTYISSLCRLGLIDIDSHAPLASPELYRPYEEAKFYNFFSLGASTISPPKKADIIKYSGRLTPLGKNFREICVE